MKDGGAVFPFIVYHSEGRGSSVEGSYMDKGLTLRDWFAGQALSGLAVDYINQPEDLTIEVMAKHAYTIADAMIEARGKR